MKSAEYILPSEEVLHAKNKGLPIVALESTIITHGMPYPENRDTAIILENIIRQEGACPATIAILEGKIRVGLNPQELDALAEHNSLAKHNSREAIKVSTKDIPYAVVKKLSGGTTVAATMHLANLMGICVFATGGIGGVHRGAETSFDISADLDELAHTPVAVVCAGAKSILDLQLTLEYLETKAVPVVGYQTKVLPAFYTRTSNCILDLSLDSPKEIASFLDAKWNIGTNTRNTGVVIANPIPTEYSMEPHYINSIVEEALAHSKEEGISGKATTPYLLEYIAQRTEKKSLIANIALVKNNARLASQIAKEYNSCKNIHSADEV